MDLTGWSLLVGGLVIFPLLHTSGAAAMTRALFFLLRFVGEACLRWA